MRPVCQRVLICIMPMLTPLSPTASVSKWLSVLAMAMMAQKVSGSLPQSSNMALCVWASSGTLSRVFTGSVASGVGSGVAVGSM